nr:MAG TPA: SECRETED 45 KDA PROTEIN CYCLE, PEPTIDOGLYCAN, CHAP, CELL [Caudoviricetes sp.]
MPEIKRSLLSLLFCSLLWLVPVAGYCAGTTPTSNEPTVTMSLQQYETLRNSIETLKRNSIEREQLISQQNQQIKTLKEQLTISQTQIQNSQSSISQTQTRLTQQSESLATLSEQINKEAHKTATAKRQRDTWAVVAGALAVGYLTK